MVATIGMITDIVSQVGGERVQVNGLMGPGVDPHLYKASEGDVTRMAGADIIFYGGLHLEGKMTEVFERMKGRILTVAVTDGIDRSLLLKPPEFQGVFDPHVWFDVTLWMKAVEQVAETLAGIDPQHGEAYRANAKAYLGKLSELHEYVKTRAGELAPWPGGMGSRMISPSLDGLRPRSLCRIECSILEMRAFSPGLMVMSRASGTCSEAIWLMGDAWP